MKKIASLFLLLTCLVVMSTQTALAEVVVNDGYIQQFSQPEGTHSASVLMTELGTDTVVYDKNSDQSINPGALVKIMTALLVLEYEKDLDQEIICDADIMNDPYWGTSGAQHSRLLANDNIKIANLMRSMLVQSDCDTALVLARYIGKTYLGGDEETFVQQMNIRAEELGCTATNFVNVHGLNADGQVSTARDMTIITTAAVEFDEYTDLSSYNYFKLAPSDVRDYSVAFYAENQMSSIVSDYYYSLALNIRMGRTANNGQHMVTLVRGGLSDYLIVAMDAPYLDEEGYRTNFIYDDAISLFDWAYDQFTIRTVVEKQDVSHGAEVSVNLSTEKNYTLAVAEEAVTLVVPKALDDSELLRVPVLSYTTDAPVEAGQALGKLQIQVDDIIFATVPLVATEDIEQSKILTAWSYLKALLNHPILHNIIIVLVVLAATMVLITVRYNYVRRKKRELQQRRKPSSRN